VFLVNNVKDVKASVLN